MGRGREREEPSHSEKGKMDLDRLEREDCVIGRATQRNKPKVIEFKIRFDAFYLNHPSCFSALDINYRIDTMEEILLLIEEEPIQKMERESSEHQEIGKGRGARIMHMRYTELLLRQGRVGSIMKHTIEELILLKERDVWFKDFNRLAFDQVGVGIFIREGNIPYVDNIGSLLRPWGLGVFVPVRR